MTELAQKISPSFSSNTTKPKKLECKHCALVTYNSERICAMCELFGPSRSKRMQKEFSQS